MSLLKKDIDGCIKSNPEQVLLDCGWSRVSSGPGNIWMFKSYVHDKTKISIECNIYDYGRVVWFEVSKGEITIDTAYCEDIFECYEKLKRRVKREAPDIIELPESLLDV